MNRLTHERVNGIKTGYWSAAKKEDLIKRLAEYENTGLEPAEILQNDRWILCSERMPGERDSIFAKLKGTDMWRDTMFEKTSGDVNVTVEFEDGSKKVMTMHTTNGNWRNNSDWNWIKHKVVAWMPLPEPYEGGGTQ